MTCKTRLHRLLRGLGSRTSNEGRRGDAVENPPIHTQHCCFHLVNVHGLGRLRMIERVDLIITTADSSFMSV